LPICCDGTPCPPRPASSACNFAAAGPCSGAPVASATSAWTPRSASRTGDSFMPFPDGCTRTAGTCARWRRTHRTEAADPSRCLSR